MPLMVEGGVMAQSPVREERDSSSSKVEEEENLSATEVPELHQEEEIDGHSQEQHSENNHQQTLEEGEDQHYQDGVHEGELLPTEEEAGEQDEEDNADSLKHEEHVEDEDKISLMIDTQELKIPFQNNLDQAAPIDTFEVPLPANRQ